MVELLSELTCSELTRSELTRSITSMTGLEALLSPPTEIEPLQSFLRFRLDRTQSMLLAVEEIAAVLAISIVDILPVPQMNACVLGMSNWRGESLWLIDLAQQLGLKSIAQQAQRLTTISEIVVQSGSKFLGLVVSEIHEIEEHNPETLLHSFPDLFPQPVSSFIQGYFRHDRSIVLNASAVMQDPCLHIHP